MAVLACSPSYFSSSIYLVPIYQPIGERGGAGCVCVCICVCLFAQLFLVTAVI